MKGHHNQWNEYRNFNIPLFASLAFKYDRFYFIHSFWKVCINFKTAKTDVCEIYPKHGKIEDGEVVPNNFKDIEIKLKYWACVIKYINTTAKFSI